MDLTAILLPGSEHEPADVRRAVAGYGDVWLRVRPLAGVGLLQVELCDERGLPRIDPALVAALSGDDRRATFVHLNMASRQALVHAFVGGKEVEGWMGEPAELDEKLRRLVGAPIDAVIAADDGSRGGLGLAASSTVALCRGRTLAVPPGTPTTLGSFGFHDRNPRAARPEARPGARPDDRTEGAASDGEGEGEGDRLALIAFDAEALGRAWRDIPGAELAARLHQLPERALGPLGGALGEAAAELAALGDQSPVAAGLRSVRAFELVMLTECYLFGGGETSAYLDQRLLPLLTLATSDPPLDDPDEAEALEACPSVLAAMVEVLPYGSPGGAMLEQLGDDEVRPLAPWARPGEEYVGSVFLLQPERLLGLLDAVDQRDLAARVDRFYRAWWKAQTDDPVGPAFDEWRQGLESRGAPDVHRVLTDWAEWRTVLALAAANRLQPALVFYG